jgi:membrane fusion protein, multidrug efflux system
MGHRLTKFALAGAATALLAVAIVVYSRPEQNRLHEADLQPVPVIAARVQQRDVPIILTGLGAVTALNTATVRSQITGLLISDTGP